ncbi:MAG: YezD family protein [Planctomycetes bacterium]|nr:YezD family protein [Planctomycetota bacterium]
MTELAIPAPTVQAILQALSGLRYGQVTVIVQDGRVMQIDRTDRLRLPASEPVPTGVRP